MRFGSARGIGEAVAVTVLAMCAGELLVKASDPPDEPTSIQQLVMYAIDDDTDELLRYAFKDQQYLVIGEVRDQQGQVVHQIESLGFIPSGPNMGLYGVTNYDGNERSRLVKISMFDARSTVYDVDVGYGNIEGMVAARDPGSGQWRLLASQSGNVPDDENKVTLCHVPPGNPGNAHTITVGAPAVAAHLAHGDTLGACPGDCDTCDESRNLISIDPVSGVGTLVIALGAKFEGLAEGPEGTLYGARNNELWAIHPFACPTLELIGTHGNPDVEALEYAFGDTYPQVDVPGVPPPWTANGLLVGFSDASDALLVFNPANANTMSYDTPVNTADLEGLVFLTEMSDPYASIVAAPCD